MRVEVMAALISFGGVILSISITLIIGILTNRYNYRQLYAHTVSSNRMEWINVWRENIAELLACARVLRLLHNSQCPKKYVDKFDEYLYRFERAKRMVTTRLNMTEESHQLMFCAIAELDFKTAYDLEFNKHCETIETLARRILKPEWERVKCEAEGKRR